MGFKNTPAVLRVCPPLWCGEKGSILGATKSALPIHTKRQKPDRSGVQNRIEYSGGAVRLSPFVFTASVRRNLSVLGRPSRPQRVMDS
jgi:hypothetical protein